MWERIIPAALALATITITWALIGRLRQANASVNRRRGYFTATCFLLIAICMATLAVKPSSVAGYVAGGLLLADLVIAPRLGPRRF